MISELPRQPRQREPDPKYMTLVGHLNELRRCLVGAILAIAIDSPVASFFAGS